MLALFSRNVKSGEVTLSPLSILDLAIERPLPKIQIICLFEFGQTKQKGVGFDPGGIMRFKRKLYVKDVEFTTRLITV